VLERYLYFRPTISSADLLGQNWYYPEVLGVDQQEEQIPMEF